MTFDLPDRLEKELCRLAAAQGRPVMAVIDEALWRCVLNASITDLEPGAVAETQMRLVPELGANFGEAGERLAADVWSVEDFSDWESPDDSTAAG